MGRAQAGIKQTLQQVDLIKLELRKQRILLMNIITIQSGD